VAAALALVWGSALAVPRFTGSRSLVGRLGRAGLPRTVVPRFSVATVYRPCAPAVQDDAVPRMDCPGAPDLEAEEGLDALQQRITRAAEAGDHDGMHAAAVLELALGDTADRTLPRVVEPLTRLVAVEAHPAGALVDLAATYMVRAERTNSPLDLFAALDAAERAVRLEPRHPAGLFNRALALEALNLIDAAADAWREYLHVDSTSGWATEARRHATALRGTAIVTPPPTASDPELVAFARRAPQQARELGWDVLLAQWADAVLAGRAAEEPLRRAEVLGLALERRHGGDASLADAVRAIREKASDPAATLKLAHAHHWYAAGRAAWLEMEFAAADTLYGRAHSFRGTSRALDAWAAVDFASQLFGRRQEEAVQLAREAVATIDTVRYPALAARARWVQGTMRVRTAEPELGLALHRASAGLFLRAGEVENAVREVVNASEAEGVVGKRAEAYQSMYRRLATLRPYRGSHALHNALVLASRWTAEDGLPQASIRVGDEAVTIARRSGIRARVVEALEVRASVLTRSGDAAAARRDITEADSLARHLDSRGRNHFEATLRVARAATVVDSRPALADSLLTAALSKLSLAPARSLQALLLRADARAARGRSDSAVADLDSALVRINQQRTRPDGGLTRDVGEDARATLDRVVAKRVEEGRARDALALLERGLEALGQGGAAALPAQLPPGVVAVRFALTDDAVLAFTMAGGEVRATRTRVSRRELTEQLDQVVGALERRDDEAAIRPGLARLYDWLIRPIAPRLGGPGAVLVAIPEGILAGVPFTALLDSRSRRYLVQERLVRLAPSMLVAAGAQPGAAARGQAAFIQDPAFDAATYPHLRRLNGAEREFQALAGAPGLPPIRVPGSLARADTLRRLLPAVPVVYFAGHAVSDEIRPDSSFLVLAPGPGSDDRGKITAAEIARLRLPKLQLVVLSACSTLEPAPGGGGGFAGLSGAFLNAGARGVVGSLWQVNDGLTSELMRRFHGQYARSGDPAAALRAAQLEMLASGTARLRSPAAWAGFEYAGR
jgi:CHAT domain-containing protein